jgi:hypothetical protein
MYLAAATTPLLRILPRPVLGKAFLHSLQHVAGYYAAQPTREECYGRLAYNGRSSITLGRQWLWATAADNCDAA